MDKDFVKFLNKDENGDKVLELCNRANEFNKYLKDIASRLKNRIDDKINSKKITSYEWDKTLIYRAIFCEWRFKDFCIEPGIYLGYWGCDFRIYISSSSIFITEKYQDKLKNVMKSIELNGNIKEDDSDHKYFYSYFCEIEEVEGKIEEISEAFNKIVNSICDKQFFK